MNIDPTAETYDPNAEENYPPMGEPDRALCIVIDCYNFKTLAHTGRYFHAQIVCAGVDGEELGLERDDNMQPGYYVYEGGSTWESRDWESGFVDDYGLNGKFRPATLDDFAAFGLMLPVEADNEMVYEHNQTQTIADLKQQNADLLDELVALADVAFLFRAFVQRNCTTMQDSGLHPAWTLLADQLGLRPGREEPIKGADWAFIQPGNRTNLYALREREAALNAETNTLPGQEPETK